MTSSKFKKIYLITIWTITFIVMAVCTVRFFTQKSSFIASAKMVRNYENFGTENVTELVIDNDYADVDISYGDSLNVEYNFPENDKPVITLNNGILTIGHNQKARFFNTGSMSKKGALNITIPRGYKLDYVDINSDMGDLTITDLTSKEFGLNSDMGDVKLERCIIGTGEIDSDMGDLNLDVNFEDLYISSDMGDVDITTSSDLNTAKLNIDNDMGSSKVNGQKWH
ncbi:MAG: DUF4097 domain-containing protein [Lachnospiraceae bacterium]|nr:DUF4097 domain-containing protein [Lachnospiraceae bacterium]